VYVCVQRARVFLRALSDVELVQQLTTEGRPASVPQASTPMQATVVSVDRFVDASHCFLTIAVGNE
jgi:hypothetical protein